MPARWQPAPGVAPEREPDLALSEVTRGEGTWPLGTAADVAWIAAGTTVGTAISSAIPTVFDAYATITLPAVRLDHLALDAALLSVLRAHADTRDWWLGYLDTGADDVVFPHAPRVRLYSGWRYVLVRAGAAQAATWRNPDTGSFWTGQLPNLVFPTSRCWLVSTLWDDDWTCVGGTGAFVDDLLAHAQLGPRAHQVWPGDDATPAGHTAR